MGLLDGKVAIITGAGGGIGRCHALLFAQEGARVVVNDVGGALDGTGGEQSMADGVVAEIQAAGGEATASYASVSDAAGAASILQTALDAYGRADVLVNNAGILRDKTLLKLEEAHFDAVVAVHLKGTFLCGQAFARHAKERADAGDPGGRIINTSSYAGLMGNFGQSNYAAAKAGVYGLTKVWSMELARVGVTVNCLAPMAKTRMTEDIGAVPEEMRPEQVAPMALFLASDLAGDVNGRIFGVHGQQLLEYEMKMTDGVEKEGDALWTAREIADRLGEIGAEAPPPAGAVAAPQPQPPTKVGAIARAFELMPQVFVPAKAKGWSAAIVFEIEGGEPWTIEVNDGSCATRRGKADDPTCVVTTDVDTWAAVVTGKQKAEQAFMAGKVKASNLGDMMKLGAAFDMKKATELAEQEAAAAAPAAPAAAPAAPPSKEQRIARAFELMPQVFVPEKAKGWSAAIVFDIQGGEPWTIEVKDGSCAARRGKADSPSCVVTTDVDTWAAVVTGQQKAEQAFMAGKVKASNLGDMMKLGAAFDMKKATELAEQEAAKAAPAAAAPAAAAPPSKEQTIARAFQLMPEVFVPEKAKGWKAAIVFDIRGGEPWSVEVADGRCTAKPGKSDDPTCVVTTDVDTWAAVVTGQQKAEQAFMAGKVKASNLGDMMKLGAAFDMKKATELAKQEAAKAAPAPGAPAAAPAPAGGPAEQVGRAFRALPDAFKPEAVPGWAAVIHFEIEGGEDWTVTAQGGAVTTAPGKQGEPTCVVSTSLADYAKVVAGELKAEQAFMKGRIRASNLTEMMKFGRAFDMAKVEEALAAGPAEAAVGGGAAATRLNPKCIGKVHRGPEPAFVRPEHARLFAKATQDDNPAYRDAAGPSGPIAPPMFAVRLLKDVLFRTIGDEELNADMLRLVHGEQDMEFLSPLHHWDLTATRAEVVAIEPKSTGELVSLEERLYRGGELAVRVRASMFIRDPDAKKKKKKKKKKGGQKKDGGASDSTEERVVAFSDQVTVAADQSLLYAEASLDNNPIHTDEEVAALAGFKGVILQGLCTMSFAAKAVVDQVAGGDPLRLARLAVRFSKPVFMGDALTTEGWEVDQREDVKVYGLRVVNQDGEEVITNAIAEVRQA